MAFASLPINNLVAGNDVAPVPPWVTPIAVAPIMLLVLTFVIFPPSPKNEVQARMVYLSALLYRTAIYGLVEY